MAFRKTNDSCVGTIVLMLPDEREGKIEKERVAGEVHREDTGSEKFSGDQLSHGSKGRFASCQLYTSL